MPLTRLIYFETDRPLAEDPLLSEGRDDRAPLVG